MVVNLKQAFNLLTTGVFKFMVYDTNRVYAYKLISHNLLQQYDRGFIRDIFNMNLDTFTSGTYWFMTNKIKYNAQGKFEET